MDERPTSDDPHDDQVLAAMWAQVQHGEGLSAVQMAHVFTMGYMQGARTRPTIIATLRRRLPRSRRGWYAHHYMPDGTVAVEHIRQPINPKDFFPQERRDA